MTTITHPLRTKILLLSTTLLLCLSSTAAAWAGILIIANPSADVTTLSRTALQDIYLHQTATWPNGLAIKLTILTAAGPHEEFCQQFIGKSSPQLTRYWRRQLYTGKAMPPMNLESSAAVINYVRTTPGAVGFIAEQSPPQGVLVLTITP